MKRQSTSAVRSRDADVFSRTPAREATNGAARPPPPPIAPPIRVSVLDAIFTPTQPVPPCTRSTCATTSAPPSATGVWYVRRSLGRTGRWPGRLTTRPWVGCSAAYERWRPAQTQGDEPADFLRLFPSYQVVGPKEALASGLNRVEFADHPTRLFVLVFDGVRARLDQVRAASARHVTIAPRSSRCGRFLAKAGAHARLSRAAATSTRAMCTSSRARTSCLSTSAR